MFRINDNIGVNSSNSEFIILSAYCGRKKELEFCQVQVQVPAPASIPSSHHPDVVHILSQCEWWTASCSFSRSCSLSLSPPGINDLKPSQTLDAPTWARDCSSYSNSSFFPNWLGLFFMMLDAHKSHRYICRYDGAANSFYTQIYILYIWIPLSGLSRTQNKLIENSTGLVALLPSLITLFFRADVPPVFDPPRWAFLRMVSTLDFREFLVSLRWHLLSLLGLFQVGHWSTRRCNAIKGRLSTKNMAGVSACRWMLPASLSLHSLTHA